LINLRNIIGLAVGLMAGLAVVFFLGGGFHSRSTASSDVLTFVGDACPAGKTCRAILNKPITQGQLNYYTLAAKATYDDIAALLHTGYEFPLDRINSVLEDNPDNRAMYVVLFKDQGKLNIMQVHFANGWKLDLVPEKMNDEIRCYADCPNEYTTYVVTTAPI
jgi:hypothetical protein